MICKTVSLILDSSTLKAAAPVASVRLLEVCRMYSPYFSHPPARGALRLWDRHKLFLAKQPIPAAPWLVRLTHAAGIPRKSVGGRSRRLGFRVNRSNAATCRAGLYESLEWDARKLRVSHRHGGTDRKGQSETSLITMSMRFSRYMDAAQTASHIPVQKRADFVGTLRNFSKIFSTAPSRFGCFLGCCPH